MFVGCSRPRPDAAGDAAELALLLGAVCQRLQASALAAPPGDALAQVVLDSVQALLSLQYLLDPGPPGPPDGQGV